jgi:hypothetical protein
VIPTLRRSRDDVFLIGEESILTGPEIGADPDPITPIETLGESPSRRPRSAHLPGSLHGARGLALAGLGAGAALVLAALELGGGKGPALPTPTSSPRSPLISRSTARVPAIPSARIPAPAARPAEVHRLPVVHHHRSRHAEHPASVRPPVTQEQPEREPTEQVAPVSSTAVTEAQPTRAPAVAPAATTGSTPPPGPPPSSSGGGPAGVESFGFER